MIEVFTIDGSQSLGQFKSMRSAKGALAGPINRKELGDIPRITICRYKYNRPWQEYTATYRDGKWDVEETGTLQMEKRDDHNSNNTLNFRLYGKYERCFTV